MSHSTTWLVVMTVVVGFELFTGTFYLLMIAAGMAVGALLAFLGFSIEWQFIGAGVVGSIATIALRRSKFGARNRVKASRDPNVNLDLGQTVQVQEWQSVNVGEQTLYIARAPYRGAQWDIELHAARTEAALTPDLPKAGQYKIVEMRGSRLVVERAF